MVDSSLCCSIADRADISSSIIAKSITLTGGWDRATRATAPSKVSSIRFASVVAICIQFTAWQAGTKKPYHGLASGKSGVQKLLPLMNAYQAQPLRLHLF